MLPKRLRHESPQRKFEPISSTYTYVVWSGRTRSGPDRSPSKSYLLAGFSEAFLKDEAGLTGTPGSGADPDFVTEADLMEVALAAGSRPPTCVTYSPFTSEPFT